MKLKNKFIYLSVSTFSLITPITVSACSTTKYPMLTDYTNNPTAVGADQTLLDALDFYINERVWEGSKSSINKSSANPSTSLAFPSIQISAAKDNKIFYQKTFGYAYMYKDGQSADIGGTGGTVGDLLPDEQRVKATNETMYDLASNTKMYAGMFAIQFLIQNHKIGSLDDKVSKYIPEFNHQFANVPVSLNSEEKGSMNLQDITIYNLLTHTSGLKASPYDYIVSASKDCVDGNKHKVRDFDGLLLALILIEPDFIFGNDQQYSDIDFMLVDLLVNRITGQRIDQFNQNNIYHPLGLKHTMYNPLKREISLSNLAATELQGNTRQGLRNDTPDDFTDMRKVQIRGEVHDEVSYYSMNGISGHAGLFSTAGELNILQSIMLNGGGYGNHRFFDQSLIDKVITPIANPKDPNNFQFGIGWKVKSGNQNNYIFGRQPSQSTYGHDGWTGTFTIIDSENKIVIAILTNSINTLLSRNDEALPKQNYFFGKYNYFNPNSDDVYLGDGLNRIGQTVSEKIYEALGFKL